MKKQTMVSFSVTSYEGHSEFEMPSSKALAEIKKVADEQNKWIYINGEIKNKEVLTEADLIEATTKKQDIILVNALAGGDKVVDIEFEVTKTQKKGINIQVEENKYAKIIKISVAKSQITDIVRNRTAISRALQHKLDGLANDQTEKFEDKQVEELDAFEDKQLDEANDFDEALDVDSYC